MSKQPECPECHGAMERAPGFFALSGAKRNTSNQSQFDTDGRGLIVKVWVCAICSRIEIRADDQED